VTLEEAYPNAIFAIKSIEACPPVSWEEDIQFAIESGEGPKYLLGLFLAAFIRGRDKGMEMKESGKLFLQAIEHPDFMKYLSSLCGGM
jgi:hypothetical protein